jgi:hypothetical protein
MLRRVLATAALLASLACAATVHAQDADPCAGKYCSGHGACVVELGQARCVCDEGYEPHAKRLACVTLDKARKPVSGEEDRHTAETVLDTGLEWRWESYLRSRDRYELTFFEYTYDHYRSLRLAGILLTVAAPPLFGLAATMVWMGMVWSEGFIAGMTLAGVSLVSGVPMWIVGDIRADRLEAYLPRDEAALVGSFPVATWE